MGIKNFFHKIRVIFDRSREQPIPWTSPEKKYGNRGETKFSNEIEALLPDCRIKKNVLIQASKGNAEIDTLILYKAKLFAVEVKSWKGSIKEKENDFEQITEDRYGIIHTKQQKSPFLQLNRAVYLLKQQIPQKVWINTIVFFNGADDVSTNENNICFTDVTALAEYVLHNGEKSSENNANVFFEQCVSADLLRTESSTLYCVIDEASLRFNINGRNLSKRDISSIDIFHSSTYDTLRIISRDNFVYDITVENAMITVWENGKRKPYAYCKINHIEIGK